MEEQLIQEIKDLTSQLRDDTGNMSQDASENSIRDEIISQIQERQATLEELRRVQRTVYMPGTWNVGDAFELKYTRLVVGNKDIDLPPPRYCKLLATVDITKIDPQAEEFPVAINSPIGKAMHHKAGDTFHFEMQDGFGYISVRPVASRGEGVKGEESS